MPVFKVWAMAFLPVFYLSGTCPVSMVSGFQVCSCSGSLFFVSGIVLQFLPVYYAVILRLLFLFGRSGGRSLSWNESSFRGLHTAYSRFVISPVSVFCRSVRTALLVGLVPNSKAFQFVGKGVGFVEITRLSGHSFHLYGVGWKSAWGHFLYPVYIPFSIFFYFTLIHSFISLSYPFWFRSKIIDRHRRLSLSSYPCLVSSAIRYPFILLDFSHHSDAMAK